ncbi:MAG TPA: NADH-quinone oxidoreductase subunit M [Pyrinomonadaceae bacterium]|jgi:NADH-quinone oxidoreductase subunit M|nr:NADH-quinone oxidoreductase subunit M [Pyrinomonadaceae bacterium]
MQQYLITILILLPVVGAAAVALHGVAPYADRRHYRWIALGFSLATFALSLLLLNGSSEFGRTGALHFVQDVPWVESIGARYHVGVDGLSLWLVLLTTLLVPVAILSSWTSVEKHELAFFAAMLVLESAMIGVFVSLDLLLFFLFFEASLVPMFFLIGVWGGERKLYAAIKFYIYTAVGSLLMLAGIIALWYAFGTFDYVRILTELQADPGKLTPEWTFWLFLAFALAFSIKVPLFPFHTWLPDAHTEAPTAGSVILAGVLLKMGTYGLLRFNFALFPDATRRLAWVFVILAVVGIIYGALVAMVQPDVKRLVAYSSVSHMGFVVLGMFSFTEWGMQGALYQMLNHGVSTGALFLLVGMVYERRHTRMISEFGGLSKPMPWFATFFVISALSSVGLPLLNGFVGEFLIMFGTWNTGFSYAFNLPYVGSTFHLNPWVVTMLAATGVIWAAVYMLWMLQRVLFGRVTHAENRRLADLNWREIGLLLPLLALMLYMGAYPRPFLDRSRASVEQVRTRVLGGESQGTFHDKEQAAK